MLFLCFHSYLFIATGEKVSKLNFFYCVFKESATPADERKRVETKKLLLVSSSK